MAASDVPDDGDREGGGGGRLMSHDLRRVESILRAWDPIGVDPGVRAPLGEYDAYAPALLALALQGASAPELAERLGELAAGAMGLRRRPSVDLAASVAILATLESRCVSGDLELSPDAVRGLEYDWLACDMLGNVALFTTAGFGVAPTGLLRDPEAHERGIATVLAGPPSTAARCAPTVGLGRVNTWHLMVERGFYAFDGDPQDGSYRRVGVPCEPRRIVDVGVEVAAVALTAHLINVRFDLLDRAGSMDIA